MENTYQHKIFLIKEKEKVECLDIARPTYKKKKKLQKIAIKCIGVTKLPVLHLQDNSLRKCEQKSKLQGLFSLEKAVG